MALRRQKEDLENDDCLKRKAALDSDAGTCNDGYIHAPIDKLGVTGRWFRHKLLDGILVGTPVLLTIQRHRTSLRTSIMKTLSFLGTEDFYTILFIFLLWSVDSRLGRLFGTLLGIGFYCTGFLKTMLCLPRPPCPPITPLEKAYDWALPSHHSLLGVIMPWYIWLYTALHFEMASGALSVVCTLIALWSFGVLLSRLYLGVHSPADIVCGGICGVLVLSMWMQVDDYVDFYISQPQLEPQLKLIAAMLLMLCLHPTTEAGNPSFTDTCTTTGVVAGIILGRSQRARLLGMSALLETQPDMGWLTFIQLSVARLIIGGVLIVVLKSVLKLFLSVSVKQIYRLAGFPVFSSSSFRKTMPPNPKHYTKEFRLPPIYAETTKGDDDELSVADTSSDNSCASSAASDVSGVDSVASKMNAGGAAPSWMEYVQISNVFLSLTSKSEEPWDIDIPCKMVTYTIMTFLMMDIVPRFFLLIGI